MDLEEMKLALLRMECLIEMMENSHSIINIAIAIKETLSKQIELSEKGAI